MVNDKLAVYEMRHLFKLVEELDVLETHWWELSKATYGFSLDLSIVEAQISQREQLILDTLRAFRYVNNYPNGEKDVTA